MPTIRHHKSKEIVRLIGMGDSGTGKSGSLPEVINRMDELGFSKVVIQDYDDGLDIVKANVKEEFYDRVFFETLRDEMKGAVPSVREASGPIIRGDPTAWARGMTLLNNWKVESKKDPKTEEIIPGYDLGPATSWGADVLYVTDTLTGMGDACMNYVKFVDSKLNDWKATGQAMRLQDKYTQMIVTLNCNLILFSHVRYMGGGGSVTIEEKAPGGAVMAAHTKEVDSNIDGQGYPSALGRILPMQLCRHFNFALEWKLVGKKRKVRTVPEDRLTLKCPIKMPEEMDQRTGLYELFKTARGK